jgi:hypoxanthine phosphoribosyltransferase
MSAMGHYVEKDISGVLISEDEIKDKVRELGDRISRDYEGRRLVAVCILKGSIVFFADLIRSITIPAEVECMAASSYGAGAESSGRVDIQYDIGCDIKDKDVLIVEDIIDTGITLALLKEKLEERGPRSLEICCLLDKADRREVEVPVKYTGFVIPDEFVVGYGLDYNSLYRNYSGVGILKREVYSG